MLKLKNKKIIELQDKAFNYYSTLSAREKIFLQLGIIILFGIIIQSLYTPIVDAFISQKEEITKLENDIKTRLPVEIKNYVKLKTLRQDIENDYKQLELREGTLSYLEKLLKDKIGTAQGPFKINDNQPPLPFGTIYEKTPFIIQFDSTNLKNLTEFLRLLVYGEIPFLITKLDIVKSYKGLNVTVDVVSISKKS